MIHVRGDIRIEAYMNESILLSVKKALGLTDDYTYFDRDIIMHINSVFTVLNQLGVGPDAGFFIDDSSALWSDYGEMARLEFIKTYVYLKVRLLFDPPTSSFVLSSMETTARELEWRINVMAETLSNTQG